MADKYRNDNHEHRRIRLGIDLGDGISCMVNGFRRFSPLLRARVSGFELPHNGDLADRP
jgi:sterol 24-C-methyltransferase